MSSKHGLSRPRTMKQMQKTTGPLPEDRKLTSKHLRQSIEWNKAHAKEHMDAAKERRAKLRKLSKMK